MKALQKELPPKKRQKMKAQRKPTTPQLGTNDYDNIGKCVQETLEESMTAIVSSQTEMKSTLDMKIVELKTLLERATQIPTTTTTTFGTLRGESTSQGRT